MPKTRYFRTAQGWLADTVGTETDEFSVSMEVHERDLGVYYGAVVIGMELDASVPDPRFGAFIDPPVQATQE